MPLILGELVLFAISFFQFRVRCVCWNVKKIVIFASQRGQNGISTKGEDATNVSLTMPEK
jgi:hypothetical protein